MMIDSFFRSTKSFHFSNLLTFLHKNSHSYICTYYILIFLCLTDGKLVVVVVDLADLVGSSGTRFCNAIMSILFKKHTNVVMITKSIFIL